MGISRVSDRIAAGALIESFVEIRLILDDNDVTSHGDGFLPVTHALGALKLATAHSSSVVAIELAADLLRHQEMSILLLEIEVWILRVAGNLRVPGWAELQIFVPGRILHLEGLITHQLAIGNSRVLHWV